MSELVRRAGRGQDATGALIVWSVAEGRRGRRWREVRSIAGSGVVSSLLLETDPSGRFNHVELGTEAGLLTLHPESDGTLHGNLVGAGGVAHIAGVPWEPDGLVLVEGSTIAGAAAAGVLRGQLRVGESTSRACVLVPLDLVIRRRPVSVERLTEDSWNLSLVCVTVDAERLPLLTGGRIWPLEAE